MKLFERSGGYYLFWTGAVYLLFGLSLIGTDYTVFAGPIWILILTLPFAIPPFGRWLNMDITWDKEMFEKWFGKKDNNTSNVVPFPELKEVPKVEPPKKEEKPATIFYRIGITDKQRIAFSMGYSEITMNKRGVQQMIDQLTVFMNQIEDEDELNSN